MLCWGQTFLFGAGIKCMRHCGPLGVLHIGCIGRNVIAILLNVRRDVNCQNDGRQFRVAKDSKVLFSLCLTHK